MKQGYLVLVVRLVFRKRPREARCDPISNLEVQRWWGAMGPNGDLGTDWRGTHGITREGGVAGRGRRVELEV